MRKLRPVIAGMTLCLLAACGGGGGEGSTPGQPVDPSMVGLSIDRTDPIVFVQEQGQSAPPHVTVHMTYGLPNRNIGVGPAVTWLNFFQSPDSKATSPLTLEVGLNDPFVKLLAQGHYTSTIKFQQWQDNSALLGLISLPVTVLIPHSFGLRHSDLSVSQGQVGTQAAVHIQLQADTVRWSAKTSAPWLAVDQAGGTGSTTLTLSVSDSNLTLGTHDATVAVTDLDYNVTETMAVTVHVQPRTLVTRIPGVGMTSAPGWSVLSASIPVTDSAGLLSNWTANSDQSWLVVDTPNGSTGGALSVHADPTGLSEGMHYAGVKIVPRTAGVSGTRSVRVGLYVSASPASSPNITESPSFRQYRISTCDPIRPYCYSIGDGGVAVYNLVSGLVEMTIPISGIAGAISPDGRTLYVANDLTQQIIPIDLDTMTVQPALASAVVPERPSNMPSGYSLNSGEIGGRTVLVTNELRILDAATGQTLRDFSSLLPAPVLGAPAVALSRDGRQFIVRSQDSALLYRMEVDGDGSFGVGISEIHQEPSQTYGGKIQFTSDDASFLCTSNQVSRYSSNNLAASSTVTTNYAASYVQARDDDSFYLFTPMTSPPGAGAGTPTTFEHRGPDNQVLRTFPLVTQYPGGPDLTGQVELSADQHRLILSAVPTFYFDLP